ncbi:unnamed protein product, partial [Closterium sp. Naga37s-1]
FPLSLRAISPLPYAQFLPFPMRSFPPYLISKHSPPLPPLFSPLSPHTTSSLPSLLSLNPLFPPLPLLPFLLISSFPPLRLSFPPSLPLSLRC